MTEIVVARYSDVQVWESLVQGVQVMRRITDNYMNATQILKVAGHTKPRRTAILAELYEWPHEKVQGGYGKISLPFARSLCLTHGVEGLLDHILNFDPKTHSAKIKNVATNYRTKRGVTTPASTPPQSLTAKESLPLNPQTVLSLLHSFALPAQIAANPADIIDSQGNTVLHWACALGHVNYLASLKQIPIRLSNHRKQSPLAFAASRLDNFRRKTFDALEPLFPIDCRDINGRTFLHTLVALSSEKEKAPACRYYIDCFATWVDEQRDNDLNLVIITDILNAQDNIGNSALHLAIILGNMGMLKVLLSLRARIDLPNKSGSTCYQLMRDREDYTRVLLILFDNGWEYGLIDRPLIPNIDVNALSFDMLSSTDSNANSSLLLGSPPDESGHGKNRVQDLISAQINELVDCESQLSIVHGQTEHVLLNAHNESILLNKENAFFMKLSEIVERLEGTIAQVQLIGHKRETALILEASSAAAQIPIIQQPMIVQEDGPIPMVH